MADKFTKVFYLRKDKNTGSVSGGVEIFLRPPYGTQNVSSVNEIQGKNGPVTVCNCEGSIKVDELTQKQIKYFFGKEVPVGSYLNVKVGVWGNLGKVLSGFQLADGDRIMFLVSDAKIAEFNRKNGDIGYELRVSAFDFKQTYTKRNEDGTRAPAYKATMAPASGNTAPAPAPAAAPSYDIGGYSSGTTADDFAAIDDSEDLPF